MRQRLAHVDAPTMHLRGASACEKLLALPEFSSAETVMIYLSTTHEIDTAPIALQCWADMKRVVAPKVSWEQRRMIPIEIHSLDSDVRQGILGILEPLEGLPVPVDDIDLIIVPGLGFDESGNRLGRGRGFYDRFLSHPDFRAIACGLALEEQFVPEVPHDHTDMRVRVLVTDERVRRFPADGSGR